ncbi:unnamed protein product [marine sediment metagenome]|uniref:Uncharacterized protein n=1 Tax=marine sediment metagenome TaxID=412755 RepID=X1QJZ9_9ZZZZ
MTKIKKIKYKLGARVIKNKYLLPGGNLNLVEKFPGIDFMIYEKERLKREKKRGVEKCQ